MRMSKFYMPTLKENPVEAEVESHKLLLRAGMIRRSASGIYSYLPLGYRVVRKIEEIVRRGMDNCGSQEILMSAIQPKEIWEESGRWGVYGPEMFKLYDRNNRQFCLGPTAEEYFTTLVKGEIRSYKQLPLTIYQIQTKYRDEKRPRFGINRAREFLMKDAYSFDADQESSDESYMVQWRAYEAIFDKIGLEYKIVQGDSGAMGGDKSHEFIALSDVGEGEIAYCNDCDYAATDEKAEVIFTPVDADEEMQEMKVVHTPEATTIRLLAEFMGVSRKKTCKAIDLEVSGEPVLVFIPGDRELNMTKIANYLEVPEHEIEMASDETIRRITGAEPGFTGPVGLKEQVRIIVDKRIAESKNLVVGANKTDHHISGVNFGRDFTGEIAEDLVLAKQGDKCPKCGSKLKFARGIEVGNIFQFGTKYSEPLNATFLDENGSEKYFMMGSYGIGITRSVTAVIEQNHDERGIIWPLVVAPYHAIITIINSKDEVQNALSEEIYAELQSKGVEVLLDDRRDRAGVKFADRDLIGIPLRITVGKKAGERVVEFSTRREGENSEISVDEAIEKITQLVNESK